MGVSRVLIVEDEHDIASLIKHALERGGGIHAEIVRSGAEALKAVTEDPPDLILLDLNLPFLDGIEVFRILRHRPVSAQIPVVILTARTSEEDRVSGLEMGAEDYITKPFGLRELVVRVRAVLRRGHRLPEPRVVYRGRYLVVDFDAVTIEVDGKSIHLTRREFELLRFLLENRNRVISRGRLLERVWGYDRQVDTRSIDVHVGRLRRKLGLAGKQIETVIGIGYRYSEDIE